MDKTFITVKELADKLGISEKTVYRMVNDNRIPFAIKIGGQWRFNVDKIEKWIESQQQGSDFKINYQISVIEAIMQGSIFYRLHGKNREEILSELLNMLPSIYEIDIQQLKASILYRESIVSSTLNGIAYMMPDFEKPIFFEKTMIIVAFLEKPKDFKALDGTKAEAIFLVLPANRIEQAIIDMKLRRLSMDEDFVAGIKKQFTRQELLDFIRDFENKIFGR
ncbi:helix-turn-helix domain-containing protein [Deferribacter autotrophicus]|uniref:Helix-turn-helix domain-containing protein n=1 Tax=Deferribacter autotrophicus TaxID=500465 RepID=A0A5A8F4G6_9BACT|nr:helix-turn-helix domain-containing protein [Deferribacter autotrophicus]KAA0258239.1 helix-turn-helix domain-containing protein [Deferribacter autotrophicus]